MANASGSTFGWHSLQSQSGAGQVETVRVSFATFMLSSVPQSIRSELGHRHPQAIDPWELRPCSRLHMASIETEVVDASF